MAPLEGAKPPGTCAERDRLVGQNYRMRLRARENECDYSSVSHLAWEAPNLANMEQSQERIACAQAVTTCSLTNAPGYKRQMNAVFEYLTRIVSLIYRSFKRC